MTVDSVVGTTITFTTAVAKYYGDGNNQNNIGTAITNQRVIIQRVPQYNNVTINNGVTVYANDWNHTKGGVLCLRVKGTLIQNGPINMDYKGYVGPPGGGTEYAGESIPGQGIASKNRNVGGSGSGDYASGGAGYGTAGAVFNTSQGGTTYGLSDLSDIYLGSASGNGMHNGADSGIVGADGGGIIMIFADIANLYSSISTKGAVGTDYINQYGASGGGAGGSIYINAREIDTSGGSFDAQGGIGGYGPAGAYGPGGDAGDGRVAIFYNTLSGSVSSNPSAYSQNKSTYSLLPVNYIANNNTFSDGEDIVINFIPTGANGTLYSGLAGQIPYFAASGDALTATSAIYLAADGKFGVGTTTPSAQLTVFGNLQNGFSLFDVYNQASGSPASLLFTIKENGQVGIGTTSPSQMLSVGATSTQQFLVNNIGQVLDGTWMGDTIGVAYGGTGSSTALGARTNLGLAIGTDILAFDQGIQDIAGLATTSNLFLVANGTTWATQDQTSVRTTLGLTNAYDFQNYFITTAGNAGELWMSDGTASGTWAATGTLGLLGSNITGSLGSNYIPRWNGSILTNSNIYDTGSFVGIGTTTPSYIMDVYGNSRIDGTLKIGAYTLPATDGAAGQLLRTNGTGAITWQYPDAVSGSGASAGWSTSTNDRYIYTVNTPFSNPYIVVVGGQATTSTGYQFEVIGSTLMDDITMSGSLTIAGNVDGYDISQFGPYFITSPGNTGELWMSDGTASGTWAATSSLGLLATSAIGSTVQGYTNTLNALSTFNTNGLMFQTSQNNFTATSVLSVAYGGTGSTTLAQYGLIYGNGTAQVGTTGQGANGLILQSVAGVPTWVSTTTLGINAGSLGGILEIIHGGTGSSTALGARTNLGLAIGTDILAFDQGIQDIAGLATTSNLFLVANGTTWATQDQTSVRTTLGLTNAYDFQNYFITTAGNAGELWMSDGTASGTWAATSSLGLLGSASIAPSANIGNLAYYTTTGQTIDDIVNGTAGTVLMSVGLGAAPTWVSTSSFIVDADFAANGIMTRTSAGIYSASSTLSVSSGGTGSTTLAQYGLIYGNGTAQVGTTGQGANGLILQSVAGVPTWVSTTTLGINAGSLGGILEIIHGGTGSSTALGARTNLGLAIGTDILAFDQGIQDIAGLATTSNLFLVANGTTWATQDQTSVRTTLGLTNAYDFQNYFITTAGNAGELWMSDGTASGTWAATAPWASSASILPVLSVLTISRAGMARF